MSDAVIIKKVPGYPFFASSTGVIYNKYGVAYKTQISPVGYYRFVTSVNGKNKAFSPHRLVALAFLDNPHKYPCVNHKDENKLNNSPENLEWCTYKYNANYGTKLKRQSKHQMNRKDQSRAVVAVIDGKETTYPSAKQAQRELGLNNSNIIACCRGKRKTAGGYLWRYAV